jgi:hypothetical protein
VVKPIIAPFATITRPKKMSIRMVLWILRLWGARRWRIGFEVNLGSSGHQIKMSCPQNTNHAETRAENRNKQ